MSCLVCERIEMIKNGTNPYFVIELETGYVVLGDHQHFRGYTLLLCKEHVRELHFLSSQFYSQKIPGQKLTLSSKFPTWDILYYETALLSVLEYNSIEFYSNYLHMTNDNCSVPSQLQGI